MLPDVDVSFSNSVGCWWDIGINPHFLKIDDVTFTEISVVCRHDLGRFTGVFFDFRHHFRRQLFIVYLVGNFSGDNDLRISIDCSLTIIALNMARLIDAPSLFWSRNPSDYDGLEQFQPLIFRLD